jgi:hypothetical protein
MPLSDRTKVCRAPNRVAIRISYGQQYPLKLPQPIDFTRLQHCSKHSSPHPPKTSLALYADDTAVLAQYWRTDTIARRLSHASSVLERYFNTWQLQVNILKTETILFTRRRPTAPAPLRVQHARIPWKSHIRYLGLTLDHKLLFTKHLTNVTHKATGSMVKLFPFLARDSTLSAQNKLTLYKLSIRSVLTYATPVWSNTSSTNYRRLQTLQSKCLRVIGNLPRRTPIPLLHATFSIPLIRDQINHMSANLFDTSTNHTNPLVRAIGNYTLTDLRQQYKKYIHKRTKHILL